MLSCTITDDRTWISFCWWLRRLLSTRMDSETATYMESLQSLQYISTDRWFTRTWTLQQRQCTTSLKLLIPIDTHLHMPEDIRSSIVGNDACIDAFELALALSTAQRRLHSGNHFATSGVGEAYNKMFKLLEFYLIPSLPNSGYRLDGKIHLICDFLRIMTLCDNLVIADRVSIFANACGFQYRLLSNRLNRPDISYVTCLLVLHY